MSDDDGPPLVTVVTPTWRRHQFLLERCIPSVQAQDYPLVEHCVVSDEPDPELQAGIKSALAGPHRIIYGELPAHHPDPNYGSYARRAGLALATGDYITYCDDDDALRPEHCRLLASALSSNPLAGYAVSRMVSHGPGGEMHIGYGPLACGNVGTPMIMHRREILATATWGPPSKLEDWEVVLKWMNAGILHVRVNADTSDVWPSLWR